jgi:integrase/recombinase XerC
MRPDSSELASEPFRETGCYRDTVAYLQYLDVERRLSPNTSQSYRHDLDALLRFFFEADVLARDAGAETIRQAVIQIRKRGLSAASVARHLSSWRGFYTFAIHRLGYPNNPCAGFKGPKLRRKLPSTLTPDACAQLLDSRAAPDVIKEDAILARDRAMFELLYSAGLRLSELTGLNLLDVDLKAGEARVTGKGSKTRIVPIGKCAVRAIEAWLPWRDSLNRKQEKALFLSRNGDRLGQRSVQKRLDQWADKSRLGQPVHPHLLRHAFATHLLQSSGDLRAVQELLGHANISTTQVYTHLDWQHLAKVYDQAHPRARRVKSPGTKVQEGE